MITTQYKVTFLEMVTAFENPSWPKDDTTEYLWAHLYLMMVVGTAPNDLQPGGISWPPL